MYLVDSVFPAPLSPEERERREKEREGEREGGREEERGRERGRERKQMTLILNMHRSISPLTMMD